MIKDLENLIFDPKEFSLQKHMFLYQVCDFGFSDVETQKDIIRLAHILDVFTVSRRPGTDPHVPYWLQSVEIMDTWEEAWMEYITENMKAGKSYHYFGSNPNIFNFIKLVR